MAGGPDRLRETVATGGTSVAHLSICYTARLHGHLCNIVVVAGSPGDVTVFHDFTAGIANPISGVAVFATGGFLLVFQVGRRMAGGPDRLCKTVAAGGAESGHFTVCHTARLHGHLRNIIVNACRRDLHVSGIVAGLAGFVGIPTGFYASCRFAFMLYDCVLGLLAKNPGVQKVLAVITNLGFHTLTGTTRLSRNYPRCVLVATNSSGRSTLVLACLFRPHHMAAIRTYIVEGIFSFIAPENMHQFLDQPPYKAQGCLLFHEVVRLQRQTFLQSQAAICALQCVFTRCLAGRFHSFCFPKSMTLGRNDFFFPITTNNAITMPDTIGSTLRLNIHDPIAVAVTLGCSKAVTVAVFTTDAAMDCVTAGSAGCFHFTGLIRMAQMGCMTRCVILTADGTGMLVIAFFCAGGLHPNRLCILVAASMVFPGSIDHQIIRYTNPLIQAIPAHKVMALLTGIGRRCNGCAIGQLELMIDSTTDVICKLNGIKPFLCFHHRLRVDILHSGCGEVIRASVAIQIPSDDLVGILRIRRNHVNRQTNDLRVQAGFAVDQITVFIIEVDPMPLIAVDHLIAIVPAGEIIIPTQVCFQCFHKYGYARNISKQFRRILQIGKAHTAADNNIFQSHKIPWAFFSRDDLCDKEGFHIGGQLCESQKSILQIIAFVIGLNQNTLESVKLLYVSCIFIHVHQPVVNDQRTTMEIFSIGIQGVTRSKEADTNFFHTASKLNAGQTSAILESIGINKPYAVRNLNAFQGTAI